MTEAADPADPAVAAGAAVAVAGPLDAPPIVFVHGARLTRALWTGQLTALSDEFRTIAFDLPGHGARASETFTLEGAADVLAATIREHARGRAIVVGLSLGGYVAMTLAAREPELIRGLVLAGATADHVGVRALPVRTFAAVMGRFHGARPDRLSRVFFSRRFPRAVADPIVAGGFWSAGGAVALRSLVGERFAPRLSAYPGPILILNGEFDLPFRLGAGGFAAAGGDVRRVRLAGASHLTNLDRPAAFNEAVRRFARSLDTA